MTPGTLTEDSLLEARAANLLASSGPRRRRFGARLRRYVDRRFHRWPALEAGELAAELARLAPRELLAPDALAGGRDVAPLLKALGPALTPLPSVKFDSAAGERALKALYGVAALDGFGTFSPRRVVRCRRAGRLSRTDAERKASGAAAAVARVRASAPSWASTRRRGAISN